MKTVYLVRDRSGAFWPAWNEDADVLNKIKQDEIIQVQFKKPRNPRNHRRFFAMLNICIDNFPENINDCYRDVEYLRYEVMIGIGHCEWRTSKGGKQYPVAKSMSFESVDEITFNDIYSRSVDYILKHFLKGVDKEDLYKMVDENIGLFTSH